MGGRIYASSFQAVAVTGAEDLFELTCPATGMCRLLSCQIGQSTEEADAQAEMLQIQITRYATGGMGGSTPVENPHLVGHGASGVTSEANNTTRRRLNAAQQVSTAGTPT